MSQFGFSSRRSSVYVTCGRSIGGLIDCLKKQRDRKDRKEGVYLNIIARATMPTMLYQNS